MKQQKILQYFVICIMIAGILVPYPSTDIPEWHVTIVDAADSPASGVRVHQIWNHGGLLRASNREIRVTGEDGTITFPPRIQWIPMFLRVLGWVMDRVNDIASPHGATVGPSSIVFAEGSESGSLKYEGEESPRTLIRLKPGATGTTSYP